MNFAILKKIRSAAGFTMIELLVVISVIGVLAVAVLSSINPIEQINKGRDTGLRSDAGQLLSAVERYFSIHELFPWNEARTGTNPYTPASTQYTTQFAFNGTADAKNVGGTWNWMYQLSDTQEIKPAFIVRLISGSKVVVLRATGTNSSTYACFAPSSNAFQLEAAKNCQTGATQTTVAGFTLCSTTDGSIPVAPAANYICLP